MPIHSFDFSPKNNNAGVRRENAPVMSNKLPNQPNLARTEAIDYDPIDVATEDVENVFPDGFEAMDLGLKDFFREIDVPTKDGNRKLEVRVAGGDKTILYWKQLIEKDNRIRLPVMSINRSGMKLNPERHTPASAGNYFYRGFADNDGTRAIVTPREYSVLLDYTLSVWTERKRDMERILSQIMVRFNPIAEWTIEDEFMCGNMIARLNGVSDNSDIDAGSNDLAKVRYDFTIEVEGWIPLSGRIVPTVLGQVTELAELDTREFFEGIKFNPRG